MINVNRFQILEDRYTRTFEKETRVLYTGSLEEQMRTLFDASKERRKTRDTIRIYLIDERGTVLASTD